MNIELALTGHRTVGSHTHFFLIRDRCNRSLSWVIFHKILLPNFFFAASTNRANKVYYIR